MARPLSDIINRGRPATPPPMRASIMGERLSRVMGASAETERAYDAARQDEARQIEDLTAKVQQQEEVRREQRRARLDDLRGLAKATRNDAMAAYGRNTGRPMVKDAAGNVVEATDETTWDAALKQQEDDAFAKLREEQAAARKAEHGTKVSAAKLEVDRFDHAAADPALKTLADTDRKKLEETLATQRNATLAGLMPEVEKRTAARYADDPAGREAALAAARMGQFDPSVVAEIERDQPDAFAGERTLREQLAADDANRSKRDALMRQRHEAAGKVLDLEGQDPLKPSATPPRDAFEAASRKLEVEKRQSDLAARHEELQTRETGLVSTYDAEVKAAQDRYNQAITTGRMTQAQIIALGAERDAAQIAARERLDRGRIALAPERAKLRLETADFQAWTDSLSRPATVEEKQQRDLTVPVGSSPSGARPAGAIPAADPAAPASPPSPAAAPVPVIDRGGVKEVEIAPTPGKSAREVLAGADAAAKDAGAEVYVRPDFASPEPDAEAPRPARLAPEEVETLKARATKSIEASTKALEEVGTSLADGVAMGTMDEATARATYETRQAEVLKSASDEVGKVQRETFDAVFSGRMSLGQARSVLGAAGIRPEQADEMISSTLDRAAKVGEAQRKVEAAYAKDATPAKDLGTSARRALGRKADQLTGKDGFAGVMRLVADTISANAMVLNTVRDATGVLGGDRAGFQADQAAAQSADLRTAIDDTLSRHEAEVSAILAEYPDIDAADATAMKLDAARKAVGKSAIGLEEVAAGALENPLQYAPFVGDLVGMAVELAPVISAARKARNGEDLNETDEFFLEQYLAQAGRDHTALGLAGEIVTQLPAFGVEIGMTAGAGTAAKKSLAKGAAWALGKEAVEGVEKWAAQRAVTRGAAKGAAALVGITAQTPFAMADKIAADIITKTQIPGMEGFDGDTAAWIAEPGMGFGRAVAQSGFDAWAELVSESAGGLLKLPSGLANKLAKASWVRAARKLNPAYSTNLIGKFARRAQLHGPLQEIFEERFGDALRGTAHAMTGGDLGEEFRLPDSTQWAGEAIGMLAGNVGFAAINARATAAGKKANRRLFEENHAPIAAFGDWSNPAQIAEAMNGLVGADPTRPPYRPEDIETIEAEIGPLAELPAVRRLAQADGRLGAIMDRAEAMDDLDMLGRATTARVAHTTARADEVIRTLEAHFLTRQTAANREAAGDSQAAAFATGAQKLAAGRPLAELTAAEREAWMPQPQTLPDGTVMPAPIFVEEVNGVPVVTDAGKGQLSGVLGPQLTEALLPMPEAKARRKALNPSRSWSPVDPATQVGKKTEWVGRGARGTVVRIPADAASSLDEAEGKLAAMLPRGEILEPDSVEPPSVRGRKSEVGGQKDAAAPARDQEPGADEIPGLEGEAAVKDSLTPRRLDPVRRLLEQRVTDPADRQRGMDVIDSLEEIGADSAFDAVEFVTESRGPMEVSADGKTLRVNLPWLGKQVRGRDHLRAAITEEVIHAVAIDKLDAGDVQMMWRSAPEQIQEIVLSSYRYNEKAVQDGFDDTVMGHELIRMLVQDRAFRAQVTEAMDADAGGFGATLRKILDRLVTALRDYVAGLDPENRARVEQYVGEVIAGLEAIGVRVETTPKSEVGGQKSEETPKPAKSKTPRKPKKPRAKTVLLPSEDGTTLTATEQTDVPGEPPAETISDGWKKTAEAFDGLFLGQTGLRMGQTSAPIPQASLPAERLGKFIEAAAALIGEGIRTPQALAEGLDRLAPGGQLRRYSQSFWDIFGAVDNNLRGEHDWNAIYNPAPEDGNETNFVNIKGAASDTATPDQGPRTTNKGPGAEAPTERAIYTGTTRNGPDGAILRRTPAGEYEVRIGRDTTLMPQAQAALIFGLKRAEIEALPDFATEGDRPTEQPRYFVAESPQEGWMTVRERSENNPEGSHIARFKVNANGKPGKVEHYFENAETRNAVVRTIKEWAASGVNPTPSTPAPDPVETPSPQSRPSSAASVRRGPLFNVVVNPVRSDEPPAPADWWRGAVEEWEGMLVYGPEIDGEPIDWRKEKAKAAKTGASAKEIDEAIEYAFTRAARRIAETFPRSLVFDALVALHDRQPTLTAKTSTSKINQAYSTPAPMAWVAHILADVRPTDILVEPTAGNGMLTIGSSPDQTIYVNEIDPRRREKLGHLFATSDPQQLGVISGEDAVTWTPPQPPTRVLANPPFGQVMEEGGKNRVFTVPYGETTQIDFAIMLQSLETMAPDGRAVFIIGGPPPTVKTDEHKKRYYSAGGKGRFFSHLYENYNVIDHFTVSGDLYAKQGAGWPVDYITIDGKGKSRKTLPGARPPRTIETWDALAAELDRTDDERIDINRLTEDELRNDAGQLVDGLAAIGQRPVGRPDATGESRPMDAELGGQSAADPGRDGGNVGGDRAGVADPARPGESRPGDGARQPGRETGDSAANVGVSASVAATPAPPAESASDYQTAYAPVSAVNPGGLLAPVNLAGPMRDSLLRLQDRVGDLTTYVRTKLGYPEGTDISRFFFGDQIDAIAQAVHQIENGGALVVGDQTGTGKGRVVAGLMKYAIKEGLVPVFVTKDQTLYDAMMDDLTDIEAAEVAPLISDQEIKEKTLKDKLRTRNGLNGRKAYEQLYQTGEMPVGTNALFLSYPQISSDTPPDTDKLVRNQAKANGEAPPSYWRMDALRTVAPRGLFIFDESHLASGASTTGFRIGELLATEGSKVYYSSATFAKRPDNMGLYYRTNLGKAAGSIGELMKLMTDGGVPAMQVASSMLAADGQYLRRERSYSGVRFETVIMDDTYERDKALADNYTDGLRAILDVQNRMTQAAEAVNAMVAKVGKSWSVPTGQRIRLEAENFSAKLHNMVRQYLFAIKADETARRAVQAIQQGYPGSDGTVRPHKVIVAVENTMESGIKALRDGGFPLTFNGMLEYYLDRQRTFVVSKGAFGKGRVEWTLPKVGNPEFADTETRELERRLVHTTLNEEGQQVVHVREDVLKELTFRAMNGVFLEAEARIKEMQLSEMPLSPIDHMRHVVEAAGIRTAEMTGRSEGIDPDGRIYTRDPDEVKGRLAAKDAFNNGSVDFLIINKSGSTGVSMHASPKFGDTRPRLMFVAQPNLDINEFMQTLGRIHRAGQVETPSYALVQAALPAEKRPAAILGAKMAMLNANTTSNADSEVSRKEGVDLFNKYGDAIVHAYLGRNWHITRQVNASWGKLLNDKGELYSLAHFNDAEAGGSEGYLSRSVTGHLAILTVEEQEDFWSTVEDEYRSMMAYLDEMGQNDLRATVMDLKAKTVSTKLFTPGAGGDSVFSEPSYIETTEVKLGKKPPEWEETSQAAAQAANTAPQRQADYLESSAAWIEAEDARKATRALNWEKKRDRWLTEVREARNRIASAVGLIGGFGTYKRGDGTVGWAWVADVEIDPEKPVTPSSQTVIAMVNDGKVRVRIPLSQFGDFFNYQNFGAADGWKSTYDFGSQRQIVTGNLIDAISSLGRVGQIISYTTEAGETKMGILLPAGYAKGEEREAARNTPVRTFEDFQKALADGQEVFSDAVRFRSTPGAPTYDLIVPASRSAGGKYWRDPILNRFLTGGEFIERGGRMVGRIDAFSDNAEKVFTYLTGTLNETLSTARGSTDQVGPQPSGRSGSVEQIDKDKWLDIIDREEGRGPLSMGIARAAAETDTAPTDAQKAAGNYRKGKVTIQGMRISIENPSGSQRSGTSKAGKAWSVTMPHHYGYFLGTRGRDKDHVDVFIGPDPENPVAYVVNQINPTTGKFDEHKVMLGFPSRQAAIDGYKGSYTPGWRGLGGMVEIPVPSLRKWLDEGDMGAPLRKADVPPVPASQGPRTKDTARPAPQALAMGYRREVEPGFYSRLESVIAEKIPNRAAPAQILGALGEYFVTKTETVEGKDKTTVVGRFPWSQKSDAEKLASEQPRGSVAWNSDRQVKEEEIKWSGLRSALDRMAAENGGSVPKAALLKYLANEGAVRFEEVNHRSKADRMNAPRSAERLRRILLADGYNQAEADTIVQGASRLEMLYRGRNGGIIDALRETISDYRGQQEEAAGMTRYAQYQLPGGENYREVVLSVPNQDTIDPDYVVPSETVIRKYQAQWDAFNERLPVGSVWDNEMWEIAKERDRLHEKMVRETIAEQATKNSVRIESYTSSHFPNVPNYVAHMRLNERTDAAGRPGLFMEELQSDRHQQGREAGYIGERRPFPEFPKTLPPDLVLQSYSGYFEVQKSGDFNAVIPGAAGPTPEAAIRNYYQEKARIENPGMYEEKAGGIPDAPFRKDWPLALFKRALRDAVASGKEWIGWTTGETQAERYKLSRSVSRVEWAGSIDGYTRQPTGEKTTFLNLADLSGTLTIKAGPDGKILSATGTGSGSEISSKLTGKLLSDAVGKPIADKILAEPRGNLDGDGLDIGGEGMKGFYDTILPKEIAKYVKQWGGKVEKSEAVRPGGRDRSFSSRGEAITWAEQNLGDHSYRLDPELDGTFTIYDEYTNRFIEDDTTTPIWSVTITPEMRQTVATGGQPLMMGYSREADDEAIIRRELDEFGRDLPSDANLEARRAEFAARVEASGGMAAPDDLEIMSAIVREAYMEDRKGQTHEHWFSAAERLIRKDPDGVVRALLEAAREDRPLESPTLVKASQILVPRIMAEAMASRDPAAIRDAMALQLADYRTGTNASLTLGARRRRYKNNADKHRDLILSLISKITPREIAKAKAAPTPREKSAEINRLKAELRRYTDSGLVERYDAALATISELESRIGTLEKQNRNHPQIKELKAKLKSKTELANRLRTDLANSNAEIEALNERIERAKAAGAAGLAEIERLNRELANVKALHNASVAKSRESIRRLGAALGEARKAKDRAEIIGEAHEARLARVEQVLRDMGLTLHDLFSGQAVARLRGSEIVARVIEDNFSAPQRAAIRFSLPPERLTERQIAEKTGIARTAVPEIVAKFRKLIEARFRELARRGMSLRDFQVSEQGEMFDLTGRIGAAGQSTGGRQPLGMAAAVMIPEAQVDRVVGEMMDALFGGITIENNKVRAKVARDFDLESRVDTAQVARVIQTAVDGNTYDMVFEAWINNILSGPQTHAVNFAGNALNVLLEYGLQRWMEAGYNTLIGDPNGATFGEYGELAAAFPRAWADAKRRAKETWLTDESFLRRDLLLEPAGIEGGPDKTGGGGMRSIPDRLGKLGTAGAQDLVTATTWAITGNSAEAIRLRDDIKAAKKAKKPDLAAISKMESKLRDMVEKNKGWRNYWQRGASVGRTVRIPGRALLFMDTFFKSLVANIEAAGQAYRAGKARGMSGKALTDYITGEVNRPGSSAWHRAMVVAEELSFTAPLRGAELSARDLESNITHGTQFQPGGIFEQLVKKLQDARGADSTLSPLAAAVVGWFFPFIQTPFNIYKAGLRRTPFGLVGVASHLLKSGMVSWKHGQPFLRSYGQARLARDLTDQTIGWMLTFILMGLVEGDDDDDTKQILLLGSRPYGVAATGERELADRTAGGGLMIRVGTGPDATYFDYSRLEPFATVLGSIADAVRSIKRMDNGAAKVDELVKFHQYALSQATDKTFLQGIVKIGELMEPGRSTGSNVARTVAQAIVPNLVRQPLRLLDDYARESRTAPWYYHAFPLGGFAEPKMDLYGEPMKKGETPFAPVLGPLDRGARILIDTGLKPAPVPHVADVALANWNRTHPDKGDQYFPPGNSITSFKDLMGQRQKLTAAQLAEVERIGGLRLRVMLAQSITPAEAANPTEATIAKIEAARRAVFSQARDEVVARPVAPAPPRRRTLYEAFGIAPRQ